MKFNCKYAIFDNDGTLLNSMHYWRLGTLEYMLAHGLDIPGEMTLEELFNHSSRAFSNKFSQELNVSAEAIFSDMEDRMERHYQYDVFEKPGVKEFLQMLYDRGVRMCVATAAPQRLCVNVLKRFDLLQYFEFVTDSREIGLHKGQAEYFEIVAKKLGAKPEECCVFEDALYAMQGAKAAGAKVCAIEDYTAKRDREAILQIADVYIKDYRDCLEAK